MIVDLDRSTAADARTGSSSLPSPSWAPDMHNSGRLCTAFFGHGVARGLADAQYQAARMQPNAALAEHLKEFEALWR